MTASSAGAHNECLPETDAQSAAPSELIGVRLFCKDGDV